MPWDRETRRAAAAGLRHAARSGQFVPFVWNEAIETSRDGGTAIYGCGWGQVGWTVAVFLGGTAYARHMLPVGAEQPQVNAVLKAAGLTTTRSRIWTLSASGSISTVTSSRPTRTARPIRVPSSKSPCAWPSSSSRSSSWCRKTRSRNMLRI